MAVVTGSSKGMSASIAKYFTAVSTNFAVNHTTGKEGAEKVTKAITDIRGNYFFHIFKYNSNGKRNRYRNSD